VPNKQGAITPELNLICIHYISNRSVITVVHVPCYKLLLQYFYVDKLREYGLFPKPDLLSNEVSRRIAKLEQPSSLAMSQCGDLSAQATDKR